MIDKLRKANEAYDALEEPWRFLLFLTLLGPSFFIFSFVNSLAGLIYMSLFVVFRLFSVRK
jgi:hypothetical protein